MCSGMFTSVVILALRTSESAQHVPITYMNGASRTRTGDLLVANQVLSQLSYGPNNRVIVARRSGLAARPLPGTTPPSRTIRNVTAPSAELWMSRATPRVLQKPTVPATCPHKAREEGLKPTNTYTEAVDLQQRSTLKLVTGGKSVGPTSSTAARRASVTVLLDRQLPGGRAQYSGYRHDRSSRPTTARTRQRQLALPVLA